MTTVSHQCNLAVSEWIYALQPPNDIFKSTAVRLRTLSLVDDKQNILTSRKVLRRRHDYYMLTTGSGQEELEVVVSHAVNVIVFDQRMPGILGADLLPKAKLLYPPTIRIVLSAVSMWRMRQRTYEQPVRQAVVVEPLSSLNQEDLDLHVLAQKIELDHALATKTLRIANSSFYGVQSKASNISQAVFVLGFHSICMVVTARALTGSFASVSGRFDFRAFWRHSLATAIAAGLLAPHLPVNLQTAFTTGLFHDLDTLVLVTHGPAEHALVGSYREAHDCQMADAELVVICIYHVQAGSAMAAYWKFPGAVQQAVADHHAIDRLEAGGLPLAVHMANAVTLARDLTSVDDTMVPRLSPTGWRSFALDELGWLTPLQQTEHTFDEMLRIMLA